MDSEMIRRALMTVRGQQQPDVSSAGMPNAPMPQAPGLDQAYAQPASPAMQQQGAPSPMQFNPQLEAQAQGANNQLEPIVQQIMKHLGLMSMIRNRSNQSMIDPYSQG